MTDKQEVLRHIDRALEDAEDAEREARNAMVAAQEAWTRAGRVCRELNLIRAMVEAGVQPKERRDASS